MSFGFSPTDLLTLLSLLETCHSRWSSAPQDFQDLLTQLQDFGVIVRRLHVSAQKYNGARKICSQRARDDCDVIVAGAQTTVKRLNDIAEKYGGVEDGAVAGLGGLWTRLAFGVWKSSEVTKLQQRLTAHTTTLSAFLGAEARGTLNDLLKRIDGMQREMERQRKVARRSEQQRVIEVNRSGKKADIDQLVKTMHGKSKRQASVDPVAGMMRFGNGSGMDWEAVRREFLGMGLDSGVLNKNEQEMKRLYGLLQEAAKKKRTEKARQGKQAKVNGKLGPPMEIKAKAKVDDGKRWYRLLLQDIEIETLDTFNLSWEYPPGSTKAVTLMEKRHDWEVHMLFDHTKELRKIGLARVKKHRYQTSDTIAAETLKCFDIKAKTIGASCVFEETLAELDVELLQKHTAEMRKRGLAKQVAKQPEKSGAAPKKSPGTAPINGKANFPPNGARIPGASPGPKPTLSPRKEVRKPPVASPKPPTVKKKVSFADVSGENKKQ